MYAAQLLLLIVLQGQNSRKHMSDYWAASVTGGKHAASLGSSSCKRSAVCWLDPACRI